MSGVLILCVISHLRSDLIMSLAGGLQKLLMSCSGSSYLMLRDSPVVPRGKDRANLRHGWGKA